MPPKKILVLFFFASTYSFLRLFKITTTPSSSSQIPPSTTLSNACSSSNPATVRQPPPHVSHKFTRYATSPAENTLTSKELRLLSNLISQRAPCNLLFFGLKPQLLDLSTLNANGTTIFLEDDAEKLRETQKFKAIRIYMVKYHTKASKAYKLLKYARADPACMLEAGLLQKSRCKLVMTGLPKEVYEKNWDVVVVDGPRGDHPEAPGRMEAIYTAAMIARAGGNMTDVFVHDIDRIIEKWYSWEFLCQENLVSSKGKFWHFRIVGNPSSASFCPEATVQIA